MTSRSSGVNTSASRQRGTWLALARSRFSFCAWMLGAPAMVELTVFIAYVNLATRAAGQAPGDAGNGRFVRDPYR
jgi:hypothetical protein